MRLNEHATVKHSPKAPARRRTGRPLRRCPDSLAPHQIWSSYHCVSGLVPDQPIVQPRSQGLAPRRQHHAGTSAELKSP